MKKWIWLLAFPYVVHIGKGTYTEGNISITDVTCVTHNGIGIDCGNDKETCEDMAESLNEAHERRNIGHPCHDLTVDQCEDIMQDKLAIEQLRKSK